MLCESQKTKAEGGFDLRKWKTNSKELQKHFDNEKAPTDYNNKTVDDL